MRLTIRTSTNCISSGAIERIGAAFRTTVAPLVASLGRDRSIDRLGNLVLEDEDTGVLPGGKRIHPDTVLRLAAETTTAPYSPSAPTMATLRPDMASFVLLDERGVDTCPAEIVDERRREQGSPPTRPSIVVRAPCRLAATA